jgi:hypothetical protein
LDEPLNFIGKKPKEFHFVDIYNRNGVWGQMGSDMNLRIFAFFAHIYETYRWPVLVQTVDKRTFKDLKGLDKKLIFDGLKPTDPSDVALSLLCIQIRVRFKALNEPLTLLVDEGRKRAGQRFGDEMFRGWPKPFTGLYVSSSEEPLIQIADFMAFCVNRTTYLMLKEKRTEIDLWFLDLVGHMKINSNHLVPMTLNRDFTTDGFDEFHRLHRQHSGLPD